MKVVREMYVVKNDPLGTFICAQSTRTPKLFTTVDRAHSAMCAKTTGNNVVVGTWSIKKMFLVEGELDE